MERYNNNEILQLIALSDSKHEVAHEELKSLQKATLQQVKFTNGKVKWHTKAILMMAAAILVLLASRPELLAIFTRFL